MATDRARSLAEANLLYRDPARLDAFAGESVAEVWSLLAAVVDEQGARAVERMLDLGCGTGALADAVPPNVDYLGVDLQPWLIEHALAAHPQGRFVTGDLLTYRAETPCDLVTCLGNTLAYVHTAADLAPVCATFAANVNPGGLVLIQTLLTPPPVGRSEHTVLFPSGQAHVEVQTSWDASMSLSTTSREWSLPGGEVVTDVLERRVHDLTALREALESTGLDVVEAFDHQSTRGRPPTGPAAHVVARKRSR